MYWSDVYSICACDNVGCVLMPLVNVYTEPVPRQMCTLHVKEAMKHVSLDMGGCGRRDLW